MYVTDRIRDRKRKRLLILSQTSRRFVFTAVNIVDSAASIEDSHKPYRNASIVAHVSLIHTLCLPCAAPNAQYTFSRSGFCLPR